MVVELQGVWRALQLAVDPLVPLPLKESITMSLAGGVLAEVCSRGTLDEGIEVFTHVLSGVCEMSSRHGEVCGDLLKELDRFREGRPSLCTIARKLLSVYATTAPNTRIMQQGLVLLALVATIYRERGVSIVWPMGEELDRA